MLPEYLPILLLVGLALAFAILSMLASSAFRPNKPTPIKLDAYECGIVPERLPKGERFSVKFYLIAMLFIIFDVETIFVFVWAVSLRELGLFGLTLMAIFIAILFVVEAYVWVMGGFEWERPVSRQRVAAHARARAAREETERLDERRRRGAARAG